MKRQPWFWPTKLFFKRISGRELWLQTDTNREVLESDGWKYIPELLGPQSVVYSLGVGDSIDLDIDLIHHYSLTVHAFDPTPYSLEWVASLELPDNFRFHPWAAGGEDGSMRLYRRINKRGKKSKVMWTAESNAADDSDFVDAPAYTIATIMQKLEHKQVGLLKVDVEGAEYEILDGLADADAVARRISPPLPGDRQATHSGKYRAPQAARLPHIRGFQDRPRDRVCAGR